MGWVTVIGPAGAQVEYRLQASAGCSLHHEGHDLAQDQDAQVDYRLGDGQDEAQALVWIGEGLRDVGIEPGTVMQSEDDKAKARALMSGVNPATGEILVAPKLVVDPRGKLPAAALVAAVTGVVNASGTDAEQLLGDWAAKRLGRAERGVRREGEVHRVSYKDAVRLAGEAGVDLSALYSAKTLTEARKWAGAKMRVGIRGFDAVVDLPKSVSGLWAIAPAELATAILATHRDAVTESFQHYERWTSYTMRGHHGDGGSAEKVQSSGLLGWMMPHQVARPVNGSAPDPHVHTHVVIAHLAHSEDGAWRTIGAGGRDVHRMVHSFDSYAKARFRALTVERFGLRWEQDERTRQWEVVGIPKELREQLSKRGVQVARELEKLGITPESATRMQAKVASASSRERKTGGPGPGGELRAEWRRQVAATASADRDAVGPDGKILIEKVVGRAAPGWGPDGPNPDHPGPTPPPMPPLPQLAASAVAELTEHKKEFRRSDLLAAVLDRVPQIDTMEHAEHLVDQVLALVDLVAALPEQGQTHLTHHARYTSCAIVDAERVIVESAAARYGQGSALVPADTAAMAVGTFEASAGFGLSPEQRTTVERLLTGGHGIEAVIGVAGSGKTTLMAAARTGWQANGLVVVGASTAAVAAVNLEAESGIASATLASWLMRIRTGPGLAGIDVMVLDEAAMCDDRQVAELVAAAAATGTKLVMIGDPMQLRSPGVGGSFRHVHRIVDGQILAENRRQTDQAERAALAKWRTGDHRGALLRWSAAGRVHVAEDGPSAIAVMLAKWSETCSQIDDPFARIGAVLLMAGINADVDKLNAGARAIRIAAGEIEPGREFRRAGGGRIEISNGDVVMTRANDYRLRRTEGAEMDVLNGYRGIVVGVDERGITVRWRSGEESRLSARYIAEGGVTHGYALTVAKAQGLTGRDAIVYGAGLDPNTLYPAMSRDRGRVDLILPRALIESEDTRIRLGEPANDAEALRRAINAYADALKTREEPMVSLQLGHALPTVPAVEARRAAEQPAKEAATAKKAAAKPPATAADNDAATARRGRVAKRAEAANASSPRTKTLAEYQAERAAKRAEQQQSAADREAAQAAATAAQMFEGTPAERLAAATEHTQSKAQRRAAAKAARPQAPKPPVAATAEAIRARRMAAAGDRDTWPTMFTATWGTTAQPELDRRIDRARRDMETARQRELGPLNTVRRAEAGGPGVREGKALAEREAGRAEAARAQAVIDAYSAWTSAKTESRKADHDLKDAQNAKGGAKFWTWHERDEQAIAAAAAVNDAKDKVNETKTVLDEARENGPKATAYGETWPDESNRLARIVRVDQAAEQRFPDELAAARDQDAAALARARAALPELQAQAEAASTRFAALRAEQERRDALTLVERAIEDAARAQHEVTGDLVAAARDALAAADRAPADYRPWTEREYGRYTDRGLAQQAKEVRGRIKDAAALLDAERVRMTREIGDVEDGNGPAMTRLTEEGEQLRQRAEQDVAAEPLRAEHTEAAAAVRELRGEIARLEAQLRDHGRIWWAGRQLTTPEAVRDHIDDDLAPALAQSEQARDAALAALNALPGGHPGPSGDARTQLNYYEQHLDESTETAMTRDREALARRHEVQLREVGTIEAGLAAYRDDLANIGAERELRTALPAPISGAETVSRNGRIAEQVAERREQEAARQAYREQMAAWREQYPEAARAEQQRSRSHTYDSPSPGISHGGLSL